MIGRVSPPFNTQSHGLSPVSAIRHRKKNPSKSPQFMQTKQERMEVYSPRTGPGPITGLSKVSSDSQMKV